MQNNRIKETADMTTSIHIRIPAASSDGNAPIGSGEVLTAGASSNISVGY